VKVVGPGLVGAAFAVAVAAGLRLRALPEGGLLRDHLYTWIVAGPFRAEAALRLDALSAVMALVVTGVGFLIHVYSVGYMHGDRGFARYFAYLNLFTTAMLILVLADNLPLLFVGWEGVGLCSYLLIGFWYEKTENAAAGKSAQIPLYVWLPDAMAGPTPVSALIHAATMVTAGVYMIARLHAVYALAPAALTVVAVVGAATALFAAVIATAQTDIKRVLAYSTVSQLGYMFLGLGVGATGAAIFHLVTHAFFKALLFLGAGSVIHGLGGEQDMRRMGGLRTRMPVTFWTMTAAALALA